MKLFFAIVSKYFHIPNFTNMLCGKIDLETLNGNIKSQHAKMLKSLKCPSNQESQSV